MNNNLALGAALCAALLFTPLARAQDLYVGSNTPANTLDLTNGTNAYANTYVGSTVDASNNALGVYNAGTLLTNTSELFVGRQGSGNTMTVADGAVVAAVTSYMGSWAVSSNNSVLVTGTNSMWQNSSVLHVGYSGNGNRLVISNGGTALNAIGSIGAFGSDNIVEVTGAGSLWTNSGELWLGYETNANGNQLVVSNGGTVAADRLLVGYWRGSLSNSLVVTGTNSLLQASNVVVGRAGAGNQLVVSDGGTLASAQYGNLGQNFSSSNNVALVTGAGSLWTNALDLYIGGLGSGNRLTVSNAGTVANAAGVVGSSSIANGNEVVVTGTNSLWTNSAGLTIGNFGSSNSMVIADGGTVANGNGVIGYTNTASNNRVLVTGANSLWTNSGDLFVGYEGSSNSLVISNGGTVANADGYIGFDSNSTGNSVLVTGTDSVWTNSGDLYVGYSGTGHRMVIADGGKVYNVNGFDDGASPLDSSNSVLVTDAGSAWVNSGNLTFGLAGHDNSLVISNGGLVTVRANAYAGDLATASNNSVLVNGTNAGGAASTLSVVGSLFVGNFGSGNSLVISNGGTVAVATNGYIGYDSNSTGNTVLVTGSNSVWTNSRDLYVGFAGSGNSLVIADGGKVADASGVIGEAATASNNSVQVTGAGSRWETAYGLTIGVGGSGNSLVISNGGTVANTEGYIGMYDTSPNNSVLVTGTNSLWTNSDLTVGYNGSGNSLTIADGGTVAVGTDRYIGYRTPSSNNSVLVTGTGSLWSGGDLYVGYSGSGSSLVISNGGTVANTGGYIGMFDTSPNNSVLVTGTNSLWTNSGDLYVGRSGAGNSLTLDDGSTVAASSISIAANVGSSGTLNIGRFGTNDTGGTIIAPTIAFCAGTGAINFNQSDAVTITSAISGAGTLNQLGAGTTTLTASNTYTGATTVAAGRLVVDGSIAGSTVTVQSGGTLSGSGTTGGLIVSTGGTLSPGSSPGTTSVAGNVVWNAGGNYNWQIYNTALGAGSGWDLVSATGPLDLTALTVGSEFNINLWSLSAVAPDASGNALNFDPNQNYTWTILTAAGGISGFVADKFLINTGAINGTGGFANALSGGTFSMVQDNNNLNLVFTSASAPIPEPGTWAAMALLAAGAAFMRWRKRAKVS